MSYASRFAFHVSRFTFHVLRFTFYVLRFTCADFRMTGLFTKFKAGLQKTHTRLAHEIKRIVTRSPRLDAAGLEELEAALIAADIGMAMTTQIVDAVQRTYETQGTDGPDVFAVAEREVESSLSTNDAELRRAPAGP